MSEIRSWDRTMSKPGGVVYDTPEPGDDQVRVVMWPKGAPKQEDVPQAGERVQYNECPTPYYIISGIPFKKHGHKSWSLLTRNDTGSWTGDVVIETLFSWPSSPELRTYTEGEIREAMADAEDIHSTYKASISLGQALIEEMQRRKP